MTSTGSRGLDISIPKSPGSPVPKGPIEASRQNSDTFRMLDLPGEVRNMIYEHVFASQTYQPHIRWTPYRLTILNPRHVLALLYVSRQVHTETSLLSYSCMTFSFSDNRYFNDFLNVLTPTQTKAVQHLQLNTKVLSYHNSQNSFESCTLLAGVFSSKGNWEWDWLGRISAEMIGVKTLELVVFDDEVQPSGRETKDPRVLQVMAWICEWLPEVKVVARDRIVEEDDGELRWLDLLQSDSETDSDDDENPDDDQNSDTDQDGGYDTESDHNQGNDVDSDSSED
jgi:hypothetical protein